MAEWTVPGYTGLRALGSGGFGEVVLARHDATGTLVAIKYLRGELLADRGFTEMFRAEAGVLASLADPNIVWLYEYVETPAGAAIVMEVVDGVSLRQILARQGHTTAEAALVVLQGSLLGLAAAHRRGVVHRDYKPENVLVDRAGGSKLTDFGIAARAGDRPLPAGTVAYVAPEQIAGAPATPAGDVYAATGTFYECLTGAPPFAGDTQQVLAAHQYAPVPLDPVPAPLRPLVVAGMAKDPAWRPADARTLVTALQAAAAPAYGPDWAARGRSHLGEAALLLAALWPSAAAPATQSTAITRISLVRRAGARVSPVKAVIVAGVVAAVAAGGVVVANAVSHAHHAGHHHTAAPPPAAGSAGKGAVPTAYVADQGSGTVTPIGTATNTLGPPIPVGRQPIAIAVTPDGKTAYVVNNADATVTPIRTATNTPGTPIPVGRNPTAIAITPDGKTAYVVNEADATVTPIRTATNTPGTPIQVGGHPEEIAVTPDGKTAYVSSSIPGMVTPISTSTNVPGPSIRVGEALFGIAVTPDGKTAYAADTANSTVIPINLATKAPGTPINVGQLPGGVAISPDGKTVYVTNYGDGTVTPIDVATNTPGAPIHVGKHPHGIVITH